MQVSRDEVVEMLKQRLNITRDKAKLKRVSLRRYKSVSRSAFGLDKGRKKIAIIRASGSISTAQGLLSVKDTIKPKHLIKELRQTADRKDVAAIVLRIDSPGGDGLASDLMWREIGRVTKEKPVIASMADVAASGGYYLAMAAEKIVAERLTITGSIGVVLAKIGLGELYKRIGCVPMTVFWALGMVLGWQRRRCPKAGMRNCFLIIGASQKMKASIGRS